YQYSTPHVTPLQAMENTPPPPEVGHSTVPFENIHKEILSHGREAVCASRLNAFSRKGGLPCCASTFRESVLAWQPCSRYSCRPPTPRRRRLARPWEVSSTMPPKRPSPAPRSHWRAQKKASLEPSQPMRTDDSRLPCCRHRPTR